MIIILLIGLVMIGGMVACLVYVGKRGGFSTKMRSQITMRAGEVSLLATEIVWFAKKFYWNKYKIPHGVLDITNKRAVYTRTSGDRVEFALEKAEIKRVVKAGAIRVKLEARDGKVYSFNTYPPKDTLDAFERMGVPVER